MLIFTAADIARNFEARDHARGKAYQAEGRVEDVIVTTEGRRVEAQVQGTDANPYRVFIDVQKRGPRIVMDAECSCPVGYMCKHAVAALYEALAQDVREAEFKRRPLPMGHDKESAPALSPKTQRWLDALLPPPAPYDGGKETRLVYLILPRGDETSDPSFIIAPAKQLKLRDGTWNRPARLSFQHLAALRSGYGPETLSPEDKNIFSLFASSDNSYSYGPVAWHVPADAEIASLSLTRLIATGRAFADETARRPLTRGEPMPAKLGWSLIGDGRQTPVLRPERGEVLILFSRAPWYIEPLTGQAGPLHCAEPPELVAQFLRGASVDEREAKTLRQILKQADAAIPAPRTIRKSRDKNIKPRALITLHATERDESQLKAFLRFAYGHATAHPADPATHFQNETDDEIVLMPRDKAEEKSLIKRAESFGLKAGQPAENDPRGLPLFPPDDISPWFWMDFLHETAPLMRTAGLEVVADPAFHADIVAPDTDDIDAAFTQNGEWWFSLDLGITVKGERLQLLPLLVAMIRKLHSLADVDKLAKAKTCYVPLPDGRQVALPGPRVHTILKTLVELLGDKPLDEDGQIKVSMDLAAAFLKLEAITSKRWLGEGKLRGLVEKLGAFEKIENVAKPKSLKAHLRPYQADGYNWLHFLGAYGLSGILADDMGLGKTVQALAYLQALKDKGKLDAPALIVMPTSLVANWQAEAARFTPNLRTLTIHGQARAAAYAEIENADLVLTTYPLLPRDGEKLAETTWSVLILDEAQAIKNPAAKMTQAACALQAKQRLCLTGTPVENHLGEAWSLFTFLMPGLLGDHRKFTRDYRNPIEKSGDGERKLLLARRLKPFILRRLKTEVAKELPPKTEIIRRVTLADDQRDLYETVRHVMNDRVREEIAAKGVARSQIVILDALLKLRQTCCDPHLVKLEAARKVKNSAKLEELMGMLPLLIEEGRKILLFSQFTSMLDLIKPALKEADIPFVELRGTTKDRATPIKRFQAGEVPLFLISLKAGGTGLNLTAADTVIHYDPWWNPAVENQATDRAHRIGQDKPVFVYKLIAEGTVEDRILELQGKKASLAAALFGDNPAAAAKLTQDDLQWLMG